MLEKIFRKENFEWVWGYEKLGDWFFMRVILALVFVIIALVSLHFTFHSYFKLLENPNLIEIPYKTLKLVTRILSLGL